VGDGRVSAPEPGSQDATLRYVVGAYEGAQARRRRIESRLLARLPADGAHRSVPRALARCRRGEPVTDLPALEAMYRDCWVEERALRRDAAALVTAHEAWPWLARVPGMGPVLAARLLARLRLERAPTPSSFAGYCGLTSVRAARYRCDACGATPRAAMGAPPPRHRRPVDGASCRHLLVPCEREGRIARPPLLAGRGPAFDRAARALVHLVGASLVRQPGAYRAFHEARLLRRTDTHAHWPARRRELAALRAVEQLFLLHLWQAWRAARGLPAAAGYAEARLGLRPLPRPEDVVADPPG
jgi:hypothetical protein